MKKLTAYLLTAAMFAAMTAGCAGNQAPAPEAPTTEAATTAAAVQKPSEFSQIVWPKAGRLWSETFTVIIVAAIIAVIIFFVDLGLRTGIEFLIQ